MIILNGWDLIAMPTSPPAPASIEYTAQDTVATSVSPFTGQAQIQDWQASYLEASVSMPPLTHVQAQSWIAFLMILRGQAKVFQLGDPLAVAPMGSALGTPVVNATNPQFGYSIDLKGWTPSAAGVLLPGDWIQIGYRAYRATSTGNADSAGNLTLGIWPQLRETPTDGQAVGLLKVKMLWRLADNARKWSITNSRTYGMQFNVREAI